MFELLIFLMIIFSIVYAVICFIFPKISFYIWFWLTDQMEKWEKVLQSLEADNHKRQGARYEQRRKKEKG